MSRNEDVQFRWGTALTATERPVIKRHESDSDMNLKYPVTEWKQRGERSETETNKN